MVHFTHSPLFQIRLEEDTLIMHGSYSESVGCVLRGQLVLVLTEQTKFKGINLTFQGISKVGFSNVNRRGNETKILYQHDWDFLSSEKQYHILEPDNYHWDFELVLPGTLPETIEGCKRGSIKYMLKAVAERHELAINLHARRKVTILRDLVQSSLDYLQSAVTAGGNEIIEYEVAINSSVFSRGDKISVMIKLKSKHDKLIIEDVLCLLKEYITYSVGANQKTDVRTVKYVDENIRTPLKGSWCHSWELQIPEKPSHCLYDSQNDIIRTKHKLKFRILVILFGSCLFELNATLPIIITSLSPNGDNTTLPAYNENDLDKAYFENDPNDPLALRRTISSSSKSSYSTASSSLSFVTLLDEEELNKLPSYHSISSIIPVPLADSLLPPTYDDSTKK